MCWTIQSPTYAALQAAGSPVVLEACRENRTDAHQRIDLKGGRPIQPFVHTEYSEYGYQDMICVVFPYETQ